MAKVALITGVTGQDGSYLAEFLIQKGYQVHGIVRRSSSFATGRIDHLRHGYRGGESTLQLHYGDLGDATGLRRIIEQVRPDDQLDQPRIRSCRSSWRSGLVDQDFDTEADAPEVYRH